MGNRVVTANKIIKNIQTQLHQLTAACPDLTLTENEHWVKITQNLESLLQAVNHQELLFQTTTAISNTVNSSLNLDDLLDASINLIRDSFNCHYAGIFLIDETHKYALLKADSSQVGDSKLQEKHRLEVNDKTPVGWAINHRQIHTSTDAGANTLQIKNQAMPEECSEAVIPLVTRGEVIGALVIQTTERTIFSQGNIQSLQILGNQLANAVQNVLLFATADRQLEQLVDLHNINLQIDSHLNIDTLLNDVAQLSAKLLTTDACIIRLADNQKELCTVKAVYNPPKGIEPGQTEEYGTDLNSKVVQTRQPILANNWPGLAKDYASDEKGTNKTPNTLAIINVPIATQDKVIGAIEVHSFTKLQAFDENDLYALSLLASQAAAAIEKTQLFNQAENSRRFLKTIIEHIPDPIFIKDKEHTLIEMNQANANVIGKPEEELIGKTDRVLFSPELAGEFYRRDDEVLTTNQIFEHEDKTVWGDGKEHIAYTRLIPVPDAAGQPEYLLGITHDVTERKAHEAERERFLAETSALYNGSQAITGALSEYQIFDALFEQIRAENPCEISVFRFDAVKD